MYLVGSFVLVSLAGCGRGIFQSAEREPWRAEAEIACLKSGAVKENADLVRINPISGPGRLRRRISAQGRGARRSQRHAWFCRDDLRPPGGIIGNQPRWPVVAAAGLAAPVYSTPDPALRQPGYAASPGPRGPVSLTAPGVAPRRRRSTCRPRAAVSCTQAPRRGARSLRAAILSAMSAIRTARLSSLVRRKPRACRRSVLARAIPLPRSVRSRSSRRRRWPVRSSPRSIAGSPNPCSPRRCAGSARASSRSSRSPPIPAAA